VGDVKEENAVKTALASIGANGYIVTKPGTKINILAPGSTSAATLPQRELIALADQQCDQFILGQTLTSSVSEDGGSRALGEVHADTLDGVVDGLADFAGGVLTHQLIPSIVTLNWGEAMTELPEMWAKREETKDEKALAERDEKIGITSGKVRVGEAWFYERHGIPMPAAGDKLLIEVASMEQRAESGEEERRSKRKRGEEDGPVPGRKKPVAAADAGGDMLGGFREKQLVIDYRD
jgi:phage gp29-like protein